MTSLATVMCIKHTTVSNVVIQLKQGVDLTGRNTTGPPRAAATVTSLAPTLCNVGGPVTNLFRSVFSRP